MSDAKPTGKIVWEDEPTEKPKGQITWDDAREHVAKRLGLGASAGGMGGLPPDVRVPPEAALAVGGTAAALGLTLPGAAAATMGAIASPWVGGATGAVEGYRRGGITGAIKGGVEGAVFNKGLGTLGKLATAARAAKGAATVAEVAPAVVKAAEAAPAVVEAAKGAKSVIVPITDAGELVAKIKNLREVQKLSGAQIAAALKQWHGIPLKEATQAVKMVLAGQ